jgi:hypothetical protein
LLCLLLQSAANHSDHSQLAIGFNETRPLFNLAQSHLLLPLQQETHFSEELRGSLVAIIIDEAATISDIEKQYFPKGLLEFVFFDSLEQVYDVFYDLLIRSLLRSCYSDAVKRQIHAQICVLFAQLAQFVER